MLPQADDIFKLIKTNDVNIMDIKLWLDNTENDLNQGDDHWFRLDSKLLIFEKKTLFLIQTTCDC